MEETWNHPLLGKFEYDGSEWRGFVAVPAYDAFTYGTADRDAPAGKYEFTFNLAEEGPPDDAAVEVAVRVVEDAERIARKVKTALWEDFNGRGPRSGVWWHGLLDEVAEVMEGAAQLPPPTGPDDIAGSLRLFQISVRDDVSDHDGPLVELCFWAAFEPEHNVGILTDGREILGTGYHLDVKPFRSH